MVYQYSVSSHPFARVEHVNRHTKDTAIKVEIAIRLTMCRLGSSGAKRVPDAKTKYGFAGYRPISGMRGEHSQALL